MERRVLVGARYRGVRVPDVASGSPLARILRYHPIRVIYICIGMYVYSYILLGSAANRRTNGGQMPTNGARNSTKFPKIRKSERGPVGTFEAIPRPMRSLRR